MLYCYKLKFKEFHVFNKTITEIRLNELRVLDHKIYDGYELKITEWIYEKDMTDAEKKNQSNFYMMGGYLKRYEYQDAWKNLWKVLPQERKNMLTSIPEFDAQVFKDITGIEVKKEDGHKKELLIKAQELIDKAKELQAEANKL